VGYSVVTTVLSQAASYDMTDLASVRLELSFKTADSSNDAWLAQMAIPQVSRAIMRHCKRPFAPEQVQDAFDIEQDPYPSQTPGGFANLQLSRWPVLSVSSVVQTLAIATSQTLVEGVDFRVDAETGQLLRLNPFTGVGSLWEAIPVTVVYAAGYGALVAEARTVPATPFQITVAEASTFSCDLGVTYASGTSLTRVTATPAAGQYSVDLTTATYTFNVADVGQALDFSYATKALPDDLVEIVLRLITARFKGKNRDPNLIQQDTPGVGSQRWWFGGAPGQKGAFAPDIEAALEDYRVPTLA
jgi:hypothetical protein